MAEEGAAPEVVLYERMGDHIALVTLNRPEKRNAVSPEMATGLEAIVRRIEADPEIRVAILTSSDARVFSAGADLAAVAAGRGGGMETPLGGFAGFVYAQRSTPWIAAVEGSALGGGLEICLACDLIVAAETARFGLPEVKHGLLAAGGGLHRLGGYIPRNLANELIMTGQPVDAASAHGWGLVNRVTPAGGALQGARVLAETIAAHAPLAVQYSLLAARASAAQPDGAGRSAVSERFAALRRTEDYQEGPRAFVEKRLPVWKGR